MIRDPDLKRAVIEYLVTTRLPFATIAERCHCSSDYVRNVMIVSDLIRPTSPPITLPPLKPSRVDRKTTKKIIEAYFLWPNDRPDDLALRLELQLDQVQMVLRDVRLPFMGTLYEEDTFNHRRKS